MNKHIPCKRCSGRGFINWTFSEGNTGTATSYICPDCNGSGDTVVPMTNADRIRAMSDEQLAAWAINEAQKIGLRYTSSEDGLLDWLQQTAEMDPSAREGIAITDQDIINALRCCATIDGIGCATCISKGLEEDMLSCSDALKIIAADRLEELTASQHVMTMREDV